MSRSRNPKCNYSLNMNRNYGNAARPRHHNRQGSGSIDCLLRDGSQAARHRAFPRLRRQEWPRGASRPQGLRTGRPRILLVRQGDADARAAHIGFVAKSEAEVNAFYEATMAAGATDNGKPSARLYYDPRYYAANVFDPDGYSLEAVYKSWQHRQS